MLKLNYTDVGLFMERTITTPELLIAQRVLLAMRLERSLHIEPGHASFLLPADIPELNMLEMALHQEYGSVVTLIAVDEEFVEIGLSSVVERSNKCHNRRNKCHNRFLPQSFTE